MARTVTIGQDTYEIPDNLENAGWGQEFSDWAVGISDVVNDFFGPNDLTLTPASINNNQTNTDVSKFLFDVSSVRSFEAPYAIKRSTDDSTLFESGIAYGLYDGSAWTLTIGDVRGDAQVTFDITAQGQITYSSSDLAGLNYTGQIKFRAKTIDQ